MPPKDVLELGRTIVRQLKLEQTGDVLAKWMAHHLAELIKTAEIGDATEKRDAEDRAVELTLKLWSRRRDLPKPADPLSEYRDAIKVLGRMLPSADPWSRFRRAGSQDELLHGMFSAMAQLVMGGLLLTRGDDVRAIENAERIALSEEETFLLDILNTWQRFFAAPAPHDLDIEFILEESLNENQEDAREVQPPPQENTESDQSIARRDAILMSVETFQARLASLLDQWRKEITICDNPEVNSNHDDDDD